MARRCPDGANTMAHAPCSTSKMRRYISFAIFSFLVWYDETTRSAGFLAGSDYLGVDLLRSKPPCSSLHTLLSCKAGGHAPMCSVDIRHSSQALEQRR